MVRLKGPFLLVLTGLVVSGCVGDGANGGRSFVGQSWDSLTSLVGKDGAQRNDALIESGVPAVGVSETNPYLDQLEQGLQKQLDGKLAQVARVGDRLVVTLPSGSLFDSNRDTLKRGSERTLNVIAAVLKENDRTTVDVYGHTDTGGDEKSNLQLTQRRALAVARHLAGHGVDARRLSVTGFGSSRPAGLNDPGQDRRIEIQLTPVKKS